MFMIAQPTKIDNVEALLAMIVSLAPQAEIVEAMIVNERAIIKIECNCRDFRIVANNVR